MLHLLPAGLLQRAEQLPVGLHGLYTGLRSGQLPHPLAREGGML